ncbi:MAG: Ldh family oxidoreductase [Eubacterium sp.]|nr:Ldh family oxidoreductase [Eubacterium sp.]
MEKRTYIAWNIINSFLVDSFKAAGVPSGEAEICADVLCESDKRGIESHGCNRFKPIYIDRINAGILNPITNYEILKETPTTLVVDAHDGMGMVASYKAMTSIIEKARTYGIGMATIRNSSHYGIAGYWASMAIKEDMIGITGTNARPSIAPTFGVENMLGTNPLTMGFPTDEAFPFLLDCATSVSQRGRIEYYARSGKATPNGVAIGKDGKSLTDSEAILEKLIKGEAAMTPLGGIGETLGGYKGYGYATAVEILSSALSAGSYLKMLTNITEDGANRPYHLGHFFLVINPEAFLGVETFKRIAGEILRQLRSSEKAPGKEHIYTAGEKEYLAWQERKDKGVPIGKAVQRDLIAVRDLYQLDYHFDFE